MSNSLQTIRKNVFHRYKFVVTHIIPQRAACCISGDDHFHENGVTVLYRHTGINRGMLFPEIFFLFLTLTQFHFKSIISKLKFV